MANYGPLTGQTLGGKYLLEEVLGKGGFGAVYKAKNTLLNRDQAIKVITNNDVSETRFKSEAQFLAKLDHDNILHVDDFGVENNRPYLVMPYVSGGTLKVIVPPDGLALEQTCIYLRQICDALDFAHTNNIVHLDLKPDNLLYRHGKHGTLLLSDFGLAHSIENNAIKGGSSIIMGMGTPSYGAPEQFFGKPQRVSDIYALGATLFYILTGRPPFEGKNPDEIVMNQLKELPPLISNIRTTIPPSIDNIIRRAMAMDPTHRYPSAGALFNEFKTKADISFQPVATSQSTSMNRPIQNSYNPPNPAVAPKIHTTNQSPQPQQPGRELHIPGSLFLMPYAQVQLDTPPPLDVMNRLLQEVGRQVQQRKQGDKEENM